MSFDLQFVDSISATATVRLNLNDDLTWRTLAAGTDFGMPSLSRAISSTLLGDGDFVSAAAYGNRVLTLTLRYQGTNLDAAAAAVQALTREVNRPSNVLLYRPGTTSPVFFRTLRSEVSAVQWDAVTQTATVSLLAEPFALGLRESLGTVTVFNDPAAQATLVSDAFGRTVSGGWGSADSGQVWSTSGGSASDYSVSGGQGQHSMTSVNVSRWTVLPVSVRDVTVTASAATSVLAVGGSHFLHVGARFIDPSNTYMARLEFTTTQQVLLTLRARIGGTDTVVGSFTTSITHAAGAMIVCKFNLDGSTLRAKAWLASGAEPSGWQVTATDTSLTGPGAAGVRSLLSASNTNTLPVTALWDDVSVTGADGSGNAMYTDLTGIKGDVETPLRITVPQSGGLVAADQMSVLAVRRRGTPSQTPFCLQAEAMTQGTDTTTQSAVEDASGTGNQWSRTTFATVATVPVTRLSVATWPTTDVPDVRGRYRVFARVRTTVAADLVYARLRWGLSVLSAGNDEVSIGWNGSAGSSGWKLVDLGLISFPAGGDPGVDGLSGVPLSARGQQIAVEVRRQSGSGNLDWDYLLFVPADDRVQVIDWNDIALAGGNVVIDGTSETVYPVTSAGVVYGGGQSPGVAGGWMAASPGVTNRLYWLKLAGPLAVDVVGGVSTALTIDYWPRYLYARPVSS